MIRLGTPADLVAKLGLTALLLCLENSELLLSLRLRGNRGVQCGLLSLQVRGGLLRILNGARALINELLSARVLVLREGQRRLLLGNLLDSLINLRLLGFNLRSGIGDAGLRLIDLGFCLRL